MSTTRHPVSLPRRWHLTLVVVATVMAILAFGGCAPPTRPAAATAGSSGSVPATTAAPTAAAADAGAPTPKSAGTVDLAALVIDDRPTPDRPYVRDEWPHWADVDGDGCDGRQQALREHSRTPAQIDVFGGCTVVAGDWLSIYDGVETSDPGDLDIDHVVPLENAHNSGGWRFGADQRRAFANDPGNLLPVTASSNRSKGSKLPNAWRPPQQSSWCELATRWVTTKVRWQLSATTAERDALGQMLDTCVGTG